MNDIEKGWICGIIDADGSISLARRRKKLKLSQYGHVWTPKIEISSVCEKEIQNIVRICEGLGNVCKHYPKIGKTSIRWSLESNGCRWLLPQIVDHLVTKQRQGQLIIEVLEINKRQGHRGRLPETEKRLQEIYAEIRTLHLRGLQAIKYQRKYEDLKINKA